MRRGSRWEIKIHREQSRRRRIRVTAALREPGTAGTGTAGADTGETQPAADETQAPAGESSAPEESSAAGE